MTFLESTRVRVLWTTAFSFYVGCASAGGQQPAPAGSPEPPASNPIEKKETPPHPPGWWGGPAMTGEWGGVRTRLEETGVKASVFINDQYQGVVGGGLDLNGFRNAASMDAFITFDLDKMGAAREGDALLHLQSNWGGGINHRTGSTFQVNDDADGDLGFHVAQLWYRQRWLAGRAALTVGFLDYQTIADRNAFANSEDKQFLNQMLDNNPLVPLNIGLGASLLLQPTEWYSLILGVGDGQSVLYKPGFSTAFHGDDRWFAYVEQGLKLRLASNAGPLEGNYRVGAVYDPRLRRVFQADDDKRKPRDREHDYGLYVSVDQVLTRESPKDDQGLGAFGRFAYRTSETNTFSRFYSAGVAYTGLVPGRNADVLGFAFAMSSVSDDLRRKVKPNSDRETLYELYYAIQVNRWFVITPDVQYIDNPGATGEHSHALVTGVRARIAL